MIELDDMVEEMSYLDYLHQLENYAEIDTYMSQVSVKNSDTFYLLGILRTTYEFRDKLAEWHKFRDNVQNAVAKRKVDMADLLAEFYEV